MTQELSCKQHPQHPEELLKLLEWVRESKSILEIGCRYGSNLVAMAHVMKGKRIVGVDLPNVEGWRDPAIEEVLQISVEGLKEEGFDVHLIIGDSHHPDVLAAVSRLGPFDTVFIDGDHSYKGVKQDWEYYGPLGRQVIFHDIVKPERGRNAGLEVYKFWEEFKRDHEVQEYIGKDSLMGLGRWNGSGKIS